MQHFEFLRGAGRDPSIQRLQEFHLLIRAFQDHHFTLPKDLLAFVWSPLQGQQKSVLLSVGGRKVPPVVKLCSEMSRSDGFIMTPRNCSLCSKTDTAKCCLLNLLPRSFAFLLHPKSDITYWYYKAVSSSLLPVDVTIKSSVWHPCCLIFSWWSYASPRDQLCPAGQCNLPLAGSANLHLCLVHQCHQFKLVTSMKCGNHCCTLLFDSLESLE